MPTNDEEVLLDVIASLATGRRTAIGSAILESIDAIAEIDPSIAASIDEYDPGASAPPSVPEGAYAPAIIVLLTDGASNAGPEPVEAAQQAAARGHPRLHDRVRDGGSRAAGRRAAARSTSATSPATTVSKGSIPGSAVAASAAVAAGSAGRSTRRR